MLRRLLAGSAGLLILIPTTVQPETFVAPATPARPVVETVHGVTLTDRYRWLENGKDPDVVRWTRTQHDATLAWLQTRAPPIHGLRDELTRLIDRDVTRPPFFRKGREFFLRTRKGEAQPKLYTRLPEGERLLFDPLALDPSGRTTIGPIVPSRDGSKAAIATYARGSEITDYRVIDTLTGQQIGALITGIRGFRWARDERYAYISPRTAESDARQEPMRCYRHRLGDDRANDELLIAVNDSKNWCSVYEPDDADVTVFENGDFWSNAIAIRPIGSSSAPKTIWSSAKTQAKAMFRRDRFYVLTNDHAPNWKVMVGRWDAPESSSWQTLIAEQETVLEDVAVTSRHIIALDKKDVVSRVIVHDRDGKRLRELTLSVLGNVSRLDDDIDADRVYAGFVSFTAPSRLYAIDGRDLGASLLWQDDPPLDTSRIVAKQEFVTGKDGARIPLFIVARDDVKLDGDNPTLLYGYGGFNNGIAPFYVSTFASFIMRGGVFVEAGIRGGNEYGERWHEQGMLGRKQTTFDDFIAVAEWLVAKNYTKPSRLAIQGGSNGGLTVGAALTQRPDLFGAALVQVPLLDMLRYHKFLIARFWIPEYGDPDKADDFATLLAYSPYHRVRQGVNLPPTMVTAGEYDSRVDPVHAKKFVAAVQNNPGQVSPFLLYMDYDSGHGGGKPRQKVIDDREMELRFLMHALGMGGRR
ncbi:MAG TPA: prolyl oligopeptidase family serine peptidase [Casimicrobiaceae bacterium]|nr:prolyl oligopeptidase family serine peptidase [Casimicrobiaceae bacterium]